MDFYHGLNRNGSRGRPSSCSRKDTGSRAGESVIESTIAGLGGHNKGEGESEEEMRLLCFWLFVGVSGWTGSPAGGPSTWGDVIEYYLFSPTYCYYVVVV